MKNLLYLAAIAATAVGFTSCSSEEDLNNAAKDSGVPFKVTASAPTRATDLTKDNFTNFQLYAFEGSSETPWIDGKQFTYANSAWVPASGTYNWPTGTNATDFYSVSENDATMSATNFTDNIATSKSFTYTIPTTITDQKDLLVASAINQAKGSDVTLNFKHALAAAKLSLTIDPSITTFNKENWDGYRLYAEVQSITFNNINISGTYDFSKDTWSPIEKGSYTLDFTSSPIVIDVLNTATESTPTLVNIGTNGSLMFIPGEVTFWDIKPNASSNTESTASVTDAYITLKAKTMTYDPTTFVTYLNKLCTTYKSDGKTFYAHTDGSGDYYDSNETKIATANGQLKDLANEVFTKTVVDAVCGADPVPSLTWISTAGNVTDYPASGSGSDEFTNLYKPFCKANFTMNADGTMTAGYTKITLSSSKSHNLTIDIAKAIKSGYADADGAFGSPTIAGN